MAWKKVWYDVGRQDQITATAEIDSRGNITSTTIQYIQTLMAEDDGTGGLPSTISALGAVDPVTFLAPPTIGSTVSIAGLAAARTMRVMPKRSAQSQFIFEIQCEYEGKYTFQPPETTKWNIDLKFSGQETTQQAFQDSTPTDIVNTAGQPYDPSVTETLNDEVITISYSCTSPPDLSSLRGMVNSDSVSFTISGLSRSYTERQLLLKDGTVSASFSLNDGTTIVWKVELTFVYRSDTWIDQILDQGYYQLQTIDGTPQLVQMMDFITQQPLSAPALLDASGHQLAVGGTPHYTTFKIQGETALSSLFSGLT